MLPGRNRAAAWGLALALLAPAVRASAFGPGGSETRDARRFGLDRKPAAGEPSMGRTPEGQAAIDRFNKAHRGRFNLRYGTQGVGSPERRMSQLGAKEAAELFLRERGSELGLKPEQLRLELARSAQGAHHLLFTQVVQGVPVEFSRVKVHLDEAGGIAALQSSYRPIGASPVPRITDVEAAAAVARDLGSLPPVSGTLVFLPLADETVRLAWKFRAPGGWLYYVDAADGRILFRYSELVHGCASSGTVKGMVYDLNPTPPAVAVARPIRNEYVYVRTPDHRVVTQADGTFCDPATLGRIFTGLQGPYVSVSNANGPAEHYDNGGGLWDTLGTAKSQGAYPENSIIIATISVAGQAPGGRIPVKILPYFATFDVGSAGMDSSGDYNIGDDDQVAILPAADDHPVASYVGRRLAGFYGAAVPGDTYRLRLKANESGSHDGYVVNISSYLYLNNAVAGSPDYPSAQFTWTAGQSFSTSLDEVNIFYQLNLMHDYLRAGPDVLNDAAIDFPVPVMARLGPGLANAFYDPAHGSISYGDANSFALDATVVRHEYVHFMLDQVYPVINFGQNGAISEALADYFSGSSLGTHEIGKGVATGTSEGLLRDLLCDNSDPQKPCKVFPRDWSGAVHTDSLMVSQALWEIRVKAVQDLGAGPGQACADNLVFQSLFYFPDSFQELLEAMLKVDELGAAGSCGGALARRTTITQGFSDHGIQTASNDLGDAYEPNDGIQTATDISTATQITARIYKAGDLDYFTFGAGEGRIRMTLRLPADPQWAGEYRAFSMNLIDRDFKVVKTANPVINNPTTNSNCPEPPGGPDCRTSQQDLVLEYDNPSPGQFWLMVSAPPGDQSYVSRNYCSAYYTLVPDYNRNGAMTSAIVSAAYDKDVISFSVNVATHVRTQNFFFDHARLRDHALNVLPETSTDGASPYLVFASSENAYGRTTGTLRLAPGFHNRFPAVGTVHVEVFGRNQLGHVQTLGFSQPVNLTSNQTALTAWNNVFNPLAGEKTTIKYELLEPGDVKLRLYTASGRLVLTLVDGYQPAGQASVDWYGTNLGGQTVASGIYLLHIEGPGISTTKKIIVVK